MKAAPQVLWEFVDTFLPVIGSRAYEGSELPDGRIILATQVFSSPGTSVMHWVLLSPDGGVLSNAPSGFGFLSGHIPRSTGGYLLFGVPPATDGTVSYVEFVRLDSSLELERQDTISLNGLDRWVNGKVVAGPDDGIALFVGGNADNDLISCNRMWCARFDQDMILVSDSLYDGGYYGPDEVRVDENGYTILFGSTTLPPLGRSKRLTFDENFANSDGVAMPLLSGEPYATSADSIPSIHQTILRQDNSIILSTEMFEPFLPVRPALMAVDPNGDLSHVYFDALPLSSTARAIPGGLDAALDGSIVWGVFEGDYDGEPNRIHIYRMDSALNLLGHAIIDGTLTNTYYEPFKTLPTNDGGCVVIGQRSESGPGSAMKAFAIKVDVLNAVQSLSMRPDLAHVFPSPSNSHITITLSGALEVNARILLINSNGQIVFELAMSANSGVCDISDLAPGIYWARIVDRTGLPIASSSWVKE